jgi:hypothetical protein
MGAESHGLGVFVNAAEREQLALIEADRNQPRK